MAKLRQLWLPKVSGVTKKEKNRASPQPQVDEIRAIKQYEIFHRPFDLHFRGVINKWLEYIKFEQKLNLRDLLSDNQYKVLKLYFYAQKPGGRWLNQDFVLTKVGFGNKKKLRQTLISALIRIWKSVK